MPLGIEMFREKMGADLSIVYDACKKRYKDPKMVDDIIKWDGEWTKAQYDKDQLKAKLNKMSKEIGKLKKAKKEEEAQKMMKGVADLKKQIPEADEKAAALEKKINQNLYMLGNIVHSSVPFSKDEDNNIVERTWGECKRTGKELHHHELLYMIDGYASEEGVVVAGHRGYFLKGVGVMLNQALINYGINFLNSKAYTPLQPPYMMRKEVMAETAQLEEFDEALYKVVGGNEDAYLIATSEQPISAFHRHQWLQDVDIPKRYAGVSTCFRKEAGSHGKDTWGIFRIHQFEKVEQFCITHPDKSWEMHDEMIATAEEFYKSLGIPYRVVNIVSGELNNAAAKKFDLEAWFPTLGCFRELVSSSNCTDYQSRAMETRYGVNEKGKPKQYVHMLNATLTATERTICCLLENYQTDEGVLVPEALQPYMGGMKIMPFVKDKPVNRGKEKTLKGAEKNKAKNKGKTKGKKQ